MKKQTTKNSKKSNKSETLLKWEKGKKPFKLIFQEIEGNIKIEFSGNSMKVALSLLVACKDNPSIKRGVLLAVLRMLEFPEKEAIHFACQLTNII